MSPVFERLAIAAAGVFFLGVLSILALAVFNLAGGDRKKVSRFAMIAYKTSRWAIAALIIILLAGFLFGGGSKH